MFRPVKVSSFGIVFFIETPEKSAPMASASPRITVAARTAAAAAASPHTDPRGAPARGRGESATGGRADPGPRMVPTDGSSSTRLPSCVLPTPTARGSVLEQLLPGVAHGAWTDGTTLPPPECQWPTPGAAYRGYEMPHTPAMLPTGVATALTRDVDVDALLAQLADAHDEIHRLEAEAVASRLGSPKMRRAPSLSSVHSNASFATITSSSGDTVEAKAVAAFDESQLPTPAAVKSGAVCEPIAACADIFSSKELSSLHCTCEQCRLSFKGPRPGVKRMLV